MDTYIHKDRQIDRQVERLKLYKIEIRDRYIKQRYCIYRQINRSVDRYIDGKIDRQIDIYICIDR